MVVRAERNGHHVLYSVPTIGSRGADCLKLERLDRFELEGVLRNAGVSEHEAVTLSKQCGGLFTIFKRRFSSVQIISMPEWSQNSSAADLAPLLLAGAWNHTNHGDHSVIAELAETDYARLTQ